LDSRTSQEAAIEEKLVTSMTDGSSRPDQHASHQQVFTYIPGSDTERLEGVEGLVGLVVKSDSLLDRRGQQ
jgi:hypothetical protein